jgi:hypothetical protein
MRKAILFIIIVLIVSCSEKGNLDEKSQIDTIENQEAIYNNLIDNTSESLAQSNNLSFLALGDSYTIGESVSENQRWPNQMINIALNEDLPLSANEFKEIGRPKKNKEHFNYIKSYSPYENISNKDYPSMFITTSLFDSRVFYSEPVKYIAKLRDMKTDKNLLLLKCETAGHSGKTGRDNSISELAEEFAFILKSADVKK